MHSAVETYSIDLSLLCVDIQNRPVVGRKSQHCISQYQAPYRDCMYARKAVHGHLPLATRPTLAGSSVADEATDLHSVSRPSRISTPSARSLRHKEVMSTSLHLPRIRLNNSSRYQKSPLWMCSSLEDRCSFATTNCLSDNVGIGRKLCSSDKRNLRRGRNMLKRKHRQNTLRTDLQETHRVVEPGGTSVTIDCTSGEPNSYKYDI